jgi:hypothetical protein
MRNLPATVTYGTIWDLAVHLAARETANVPAKESVLLQTVFAAELKDLWRRAAWNELCDNVKEVTLISGVFSKNLGTANEIGDVLGVFNEDPRAVSCWGGSGVWPHRIRRDDWWEANGQVYVRTHRTTVWVDYQLPCPDLLDPDLVGTAHEAALMAATLPERFRTPLACRGAAKLLAAEDPGRAKELETMAEVDVARQMALLEAPWWRNQASLG